MGGNRDFLKKTPEIFDPHAGKCYPPFYSIFGENLFVGRVVFPLL